MKSILFKSCLTGLVLSATGIAGAVDLAEYSAVSGAVMNIASGSTVADRLAAGAALTFGTNAKMGKSDADRPKIYADAAVTIGDGAIIGDVIAGASATVGANVIAQHVKAGAAVTLGANAHVSAITAGAAITMGAGSTAHGTIDSEGAAVVKVNVSELTAKLKSEVDKVVAKAMEGRDTACGATGSVCLGIGTNIAGKTFRPGTYYGTASGTPADGVVTLDAHGDPNAKFNFVLSGALTFGANSWVILINGAVAKNVTWTTGSSINIGANTEFRGMAYSGGSINASTSEVHCGALYAAGAVSVKSIGQGKNC
jgi:hypothetical protein